jgi:hypothetical protein
MTVGAASTLPLVPNPVVNAIELYLQDNIPKEGKSSVEMPSCDMRVVLEEFV